MRERERNVKSVSSIQLVFLQKVVRQSHTNVTSFCMQFEKIGRGLLREAFQSEGEFLVNQKRWGEIKKDRSWKM